MKLFYLLCLIYLPLFAQMPGADPVEVTESEGDNSLEDFPTFPPKNLRDEITSLEALNDSIHRREQEKEAIYRRMQEAVDPAQREQLLPELNRLNHEIESLQRRFQSIALKTDISIFEGEPKKEFDLQSELEQLLQPILAEIKKATQDSREREELNQQRDLNYARRQTAGAALEGLQPLMEANINQDLTHRLEDLRELWENRRRDAENQITVLNHQLRQREADETSLIEKTRGIASGFVRSRGLNLTVGVLAFLAVFLSMRGVQWSWMKLRPQPKKGRSFSSRLLTLVWMIFTVVFSFAALLAAFNMVGDWFLLSLTLVFLVGVGWAAMKTLPAFIEQFRMMLNMGAVRENERVVYEGIPWKVNAISFRTELVNPLLNGGVLTLPTRMLVGLLSRIPGSNEEWFPSTIDDWVLLNDGTFGKVDTQTPSFVHIVSPGGSHKVYPTLQYLDLSPTVLTTGFRKEIDFRIDYKYQSMAVTEIPGIMREHVESALTDKLGESLSHLDVLLSEAADSALSFSVIVDCSGQAAVHWPFISSWVQAALVDLCNQQSWEIPFPQLQVHTQN